MCARSDTALFLSERREFVKRRSCCFLAALATSISTRLSCFHDISEWIYVTAFVGSVGMCMCVFLQWPNATGTASAIKLKCVMLSFNYTSKVSNALCVCVCTFVIMKGTTSRSICTTACLQIHVRLETWENKKLLCRVTFPVTNPDLQIKSTVTDVQYSLFHKGKQWSYHHKVSAVTARMKSCSTNHIEVRQNLK